MSLSRLYCWKEHHLHWGLHDSNLRLICLAPKITGAKPRAVVEIADKRNRNSTLMSPQFNPAFFPREAMRYHPEASFGVPGNSNRDLTCLSKLEWIRRPAAASDLAPIAFLPAQRLQQLHHQPHRRRQHQWLCRRRHANFNTRRIQSSCAAIRRNTRRR